MYKINLSKKNLHRVYSVGITKIGLKISSNFIYIFLFHFYLQKKECYCVLYGKGGDNAAYLACYDTKESYQKDKSKAKCYSLDNIKGIDKISKGSKNEYHIDVCTKKEKFLMVCENEDDLEDWYKYIHAVQKGLEHMFAPADGSFRTNILYDSSEDSKLIVK